ncbi:RasGAP protein [Mucor velutinosus]|uniref:RasGAP protein n=1 Tax=Mucor velutinosus TaxID=708070 RepID=A0AAN7DQ39_9FUNG|nr:RasGAP protein [Mucor velutinosus]
MKASIQQLPAEVIINIFDQINDTKQLNQCRLVSKSWTSLAEKSMYKTLHLYLWNDSRLERLNHHLKQKPERYQLIQSIRITDPYFNAFSERLFREFLHLAMTPSIRILDGVWKQEYITALLECIENSSLKFEKLKQLPYSVHHDSIYMHLMGHFRNSLQTASCNITGKTSPIHQRIIRDSIKEFKHLTTLSIQDYQGFQSVQEMDNFLQKCDQIKNLEFIINQSTNYTDMDMDALNQWLTSGSVQQADSVKYLKIAYMKGPDGNKCRSFGPDWVNYLAFKCPNVDTLSIKNITLRYSHMALPVFENVKVFNLDDWKFYCAQDLDYFIGRVKSDSNSVTIRYTKSTGVNLSEICSVSATKDRNSSMTRFTIDVNPETPSNTAIVLSCFKNLNYTCNI